MDAFTDEYLFVYGTLRRDSHHAMHAVLAPRADYVGKATFRGRLYLAGRYPAAAPSSDASETIAGEVYRLRDEGVLGPLDKYEGADYRREAASITLESGETITAWIYLYSRPVRGLPRIACGDYLAGSGGKTFPLTK